MTMVILHSSLLDFFRYETAQWKKNHSGVCSWARIHVYKRLIDKHGFVRVVEHQLKIKRILDRVERE